MNDQCDRARREHEQHATGEDELTDAPLQLQAKVKGVVPAVVELLNGM
jgi:hypothetical protein